MGQEEGSTDILQILNIWRKLTYKQQKVAETEIRQPYYQLWKNREIIPRKVSREGSTSMKILPGLFILWHAQ